MADREKIKGYLTSPLAIAFLFAFVKLLIYALTAGNYGYFRDELYFLACADHIAWGYPDHAPLSVFLAKVSRDIFGDSLYAIRLFPALSGALKLVLTGLVVRELGGRHLATLLACLCVFIAPIYLAMDNLLSMNTYEPIFWIGCALSYIWAVKRENSNYWLLFGACVGLGMMNKHSMVFFAVAFVIGLLATSDRRYVADRNLWLGGLISLAIFLPNLIWQIQNDWATLELLRNVQATGKNVVVPPHEFIWQQIFIMLPFTAPVWLGGLWYFLFDKTGSKFRAIGIAYLATLAMMILLKAKHYYLTPIYPILFAAGGVFFERLFDRFRFGRVIGIAYVGLLIAGGIVFAPLALPILPVEKYIAYQDAIGIAPPKTEVGHSGPLPQHFGDMFGWEEMTATVAKVYGSLSPDERARTAIYARNYGEAGAIDLFGGRYGLPKAISPHQSYYLWGPRDYDGSVMILLGTSQEDAARQCNEIEVRDRVGHPYAMAEEHFDIIICRGLKRPLSEMWRDLKHWN